MKRFPFFFILIFVTGLSLSSSLEARRSSYDRGYDRGLDKFVSSKKIGRHLKASIAIVAPLSQKKAAEKSTKNAFNEMKNLYKKLSEYKKNSNTSMVNRNAGIQPTEVGPDLIRILIVVHKLYNMTGGRFDIVDKFIRKKATLDDLVLDLQESTVEIKHKKVQIRIFELVKGYIAERTAFFLRQKGWRNFIINVGGEIRASGHDIGKASWVVHVQDPVQPRGKSVCSVTLMNNSISTVGIYERSEAFYDRRKHRSRSDLLSVSVVHQDALMASALAIAAFREGSMGATGLIRRIPGAEGIIIHQGGHLETVGGASAACIQTVY